MATMIEWETHLHAQAQTHNTTQITNNTELAMAAMIEQDTLAMHRPKDTQHKQT
jgi:hypothetical protein